MATAEETRRTAADAVTAKRRELEAQARGSRGRGAGGRQTTDYPLLFVLWWGGGGVVAM